MVQTRSGRGTTSEENLSSWESLNEQEDFHLEPEYEYQPDKEEEIPEGLTLSLHPFYKGHQYPPQPPITPPGEVVLPPQLSTAPSMSQPPAPGASVATAND